jgi:hypothetical protein
MNRISLLIMLSLFGIAGATSCTNNWAGGACVGNIQYTTATTLTNNLNASGDVSFSNGAILTTNGFGIWISGTFNGMRGGISTGTNSLSSGSGNGYGGNGGKGGYGLYLQAQKIIANTITSQGSIGLNAIQYQAGWNQGGGGGAGSGVIVLAYGSGGYTAGSYSISGGLGGTGITGGSPGTAPGGDGGNTLVVGGTAGAGQGGNGASPSAPIVNNANIILWNSQGFQKYLGGNGGGGGASNGNVPVGFTSSFGGSGAAGGSSSGSDGGIGGDGQAIFYQYSTQPLPTPSPIISISSPSISSADVSQVQMFQITITGGTPPYSINVLVVNSVTNDVITNNMITTSSLTNNVFFALTNSDYANSPEKANVLIVDANLAPSNSVYTANFAISARPVITFASNSLFNSGQTVTLITTHNALGGIGDFTDKFYNVTSGNSLEHTSTSIAIGGMSVYSFTAYSNIDGSTFYFNVVTTDTGTSTHFVFNSVEIQFRVNTTLTANVSPVSPFIYNGQSLTLSSIVSGGTPPYSYQ